MGLGNRLWVSPVYPSFSDWLFHQRPDRSWFRMLNCTYAKTCSGCDWIEIPQAEQRQKKLDLLLEALEPQTVDGVKIGFLSLGEGGLRDRVDLIFDRRAGKARLGLFNRERTDIVDLEKCPQLSPKLEEWLVDFRKVDFPIERGSVRLRVAPDGRRGVWLDFANIDVKRLFDQRAVLLHLLDLSVVEIGQRRKRLLLKDGQLKLVDPVLDIWFETYDGDTPIPLYCTIGSFTQPGFKANRALVGEVLRWVDQVRPNRVFEFGCGVGNFTIPLALRCERLEAFELDALALQGLEMTLQNWEGLRKKIFVHQGDFQKPQKESFNFSERDLVVVDPPRSGLRGFLDVLLKSPQPPENVLYVSCFAESFSRDVKKFCESGYAVDRLQVIDQFPQTPHFEILSLLKRK